MTQKAKVTKEEMAVLVEWFVEDMRQHCNTENAGLAVNENRTQLAKRRIEMVTSLIGKDDVLLSLLRTTLASWTGTKGQKQSYKRSMAKAYHAVHENRELSFKQDTPTIGPFEPAVEKEWSEVIKDTMLEHGATQELVTATINTMQKIRDNNAAMLAETQASIRAALKKEKASRLDALRKQQAEIESQLAALE